MLNLFVSLIQPEYIDMCAFRVFDELGDYIEQYVVKYGLILDMLD